jgi:hypothetical protein
MVRSRIARLVPVLIPSFLLLATAVTSCVESEPITQGGINSSGAGTNGSAGAGLAGSGSAAAAAGSTGSAGSGSAGAAAGSTGSAGSGAAGSGTAGSGAAGSGAAGATVVSLSYATDMMPIFKVKCTPCHITEAGDAGLNFMTGGYTAALANAQTTACTLLDTTKKRVVPGNPDKSLIWIKISQTAAALTNAKCMAPMPKSGTLTADEKTKIQTWIMGGANP